MLWELIELKKIFEFRPIKTHFEKLVMSHYVMGEGLGIHADIHINTLEKTRQKTFTRLKSSQSHYKGNDSYDQTAACGAF